MAEPFRKITRCLILARMKLFTRKPKWYAAGLAFECQQCGRCCAGPVEGYVWVTEDEVAAIADYLSISPDQMMRQYVRKVSRRLSLKEAQPSNDCIFLKPNGQGGRGCSIYPVRPVQCRTWPFWSRNLESPAAWSQAQSRCMGINRGMLHSLDEIEAKSNATRE